MEKVFTLKNLDCANCAAKIEAKFNALPQVQEAVIVFPMRQLRLTAENPDDLIAQLQQVARTVEAEVEILPATHNETGNRHCECGHETHGHSHHHHKICLWGDGAMISLGGVLFVLGLGISVLKIPALGLVFFLGAYLVLGGEVLLTAGKNMIQGHIFDENFLMSLATLVAFVIGEYPEAVGVMLFYRIGEYFEHKAMERSRSQIMEAVDMRPEVVNRLTDGKVTLIPARQAQVGDVILVRPGDRIPLDGRVLAGESRLDTAPITGEPMPVAVGPEDTVISGCVNLSGQLTVQVEKALAESMVTRILNSVENAAASKPKIDRFITRFARIYTPAVVVAALVIGIVPPLISGNWGYWVYTALSFLVMSCPCALVLSVPLAFFSGIGAGSRQGILFKGGVSMEAMAKIKVVVMDKTGTLTHGDFSVRQVQGRRDTLALCAALERFSNHPVAVSITQAAKGLEIPEAVLTQELAGHGLQGKWDGKALLCGNEKLMERFSVALPQMQFDEEVTVVWVALDGQYVGNICISDSIKEDAKESVERLRALGMVTAMLTGDKLGSARAVAEKTEIQQVYAQLLPENKLEHLQKIRKEFGPVMFVGDGINDAPVLAGSDVGAAMGSGADAAMEAADVVFMTSKVSAIPKALEIARKTRAIAWQNVVFALAVKAAVMGLGLLGWASMWAAVFADSGVAMLCVLNAVRMLRKCK